MRQTNVTEPSIHKIRDPPCDDSVLCFTTTLETIDLSVCNVDVVPARGLYTLFQSGKHTDITFNVGGATFNAHRVVVASQSVFFDR